MRQGKNGSCPRGIYLDLDSTLFDTTNYFVGSIEVHFGRKVRLTTKSLRERFGETGQNVPFWKTPEIQAHIQELHLGEEANLCIPPIDGALEAIREISQIIEIAGYLSARPQSLLRATEQSLEEHDFPKAPIILRPTNVPLLEGTAGWKAGILAEKKRVLGIIDDSPGMISALGSRYHGTLFLFGPQSKADMRKALKHRNIVPLPRWSTAPDRIKKHFMGI
ncbi:MAG: hypothetical protein COV07_02440 [Candidatus Vogelbacteria bacterium CG10_big_fil_rev_8_21_14_0_10_45_14]|uniref:HAD family hydrolase n=1 Tax=Candidatus Vogelbacteria bacterium CG10_big_fil_rev_8_21_14_0_10_45_14 TaxID=1975042 RepID=A0A2H0RK41_9BACT|nr:MAG: hypothetical protein COV07_02440 [Candidatus Vogelbacteria bacterium CG10_big_fil_rev_8_21_14_0_10_45_14]